MFGQRDTVRDVILLCGQTIKLIQQEQEKVFRDYKANPKKFGQYINRKRKTVANIGDLKWKDSRGNEKVAETDTEKAAALEEFFTSMYTVENDDDFEPLPSRIQDATTHYNA